MFYFTNYFSTTKIISTPGKYLWQKLFKPFRQSSFFLFPLPPPPSPPPIFFQNLGLKVAPPAERGEEDTVNTIARPKIDSYHLHRLRTRERLKLIPGVQNVRHLINIRENYFQLNFLMIAFS